MINAIIIFLINLFPKRRRYNKNIHTCHAYTVTYVARPNYISTGKIGKGRFVLRYNVYERSHCIDCKKYYNYKVSTNITRGKVFTKYGIKIN